MTRDVTVNLTAAEAHVLLAFLRKARIPAANPANEPTIQAWVGPTLTPIRQRLEAAIAADVHYDKDDPHMAIVGPR